MADVARLAGVSAQTVSRVSNGRPNVDHRTRERVTSAMNELGYRPNGAARALKSGQFHTIGAIAFTLQTVGNIRLLEALSAEAARSEYAVTLIPVADRTLDLFSGAYSRLTEQAVDGAVIFYEDEFADHTRFALPPGIPLVGLATGDAMPGYTVVDADQRQGAILATEHLLSLGHSRIWHVAGPEASFAANSRAKAWRDTLINAGIAPPPTLRGDWSARSGYDCAMQLGQRPRDEVSAIFAANDQMALGVMTALKVLGRAVPDDVSVIGFDDIDEASFFSPPLTTIHQDFETVGQIAVRQLLKMVHAGYQPLAESGQPDVTIVPTKLITRASTGPARA